MSVSLSVEPILRRRCWWNSQHRTMKVANDWLARPGGLKMPGLPLPMVRFLAIGTSSGLIWAEAIVYTASSSNMSWGLLS